MKRVLMVDDDDAMLFAFQKLCTASSISAETADSLESALVLLARERYDVLIADLNLSGAGGQEGFEIVQAAKRHNPSVRAFIWTAYDEKVVRDKAAGIGMEGYLTKPLKFETLLAVINGSAAPLVAGG